MIELEQVSRQWGDFRLRNITLCAASGDYLVILGPCGSGKTLLLETVAGLYVPDSGTIRIKARDVTRMPPDKRRVGLVYQQFALFPHLSVRDNIAFGLRYRKLSRQAIRTRVDEMIDLLDISELAKRRDAGALSGGEAQKVAMARALAIEPDVLLLDEPMSSLDQRAREVLMTRLPHIVEQTGVPVIHVTHDYSEAASLATRVAVMQDGRVAQTGTVDDVFERPASRFVADFLGAANVMTARVRYTEAASTVLEVGAHSLRVHHLNGCTPGSNATFCIRPEDILLHDCPVPGENVVRGQVETLRRQGFHTRVEVTNRTHAWTVVLPRRSPTTPTLTIGAPVWLRIPAHRIHLMGPSTEIAHEC